MFELLRHVLGTKGKQKHVPVAGVACVSTFLSRVHGRFGGEG